MDTPCPWPTEGEALHWECHERRPTVTAYRDRLNNGEHNTTKPGSATSSNLSGLTGTQKAPKATKSAKTKR